MSKIDLKINELDGTILLRYINAKWNEDKISVAIEKNMINEIKAIKNKLLKLVDDVSLNFKPKNLKRKNKN